MPKVTVEINDNLTSVLDQLADKPDTSRATVIRRGLTLMKLAEDQKSEGYSLGLFKNGKPFREILIP